MEDTGSYLATMRATAPLVHNITNYVAMNIAANVALAAGASPAMVHAREEVEEFAGLGEELDLTGLWGFQYALTCSRPRLDAFGGGAHVIDLGPRKRSMVHARSERPRTLLRRLP